MKESEKEGRQREEENQWTKYKGLLRIHTQTERCESRSERERIFRSSIIKPGHLSAYFMRISSWEWELARHILLGNVVNTLSSNTNDIVEPTKAVYQEEEQEPVEEAKKREKLHIIYYSFIQES